MVTKPKQTLSFSTLTASPLLRRTAAFLVVFVVSAGIIRAHVIGNGLIGQNGFQFYGWAGKALVFGLLALLVLIWRRGQQIKLKPWHRLNTIWLILAVAALAGAWLGISRLADGVQSAGQPLLAHVCLIASTALAAIGTFGPANLRLIARTYRREGLVSLGLTGLFCIFLLLAYGLWQIAAAIVARAVSWLLNSANLSTSILPGHNLVLDRFAVTIDQYGSGIESIALFTGLYVLIGILDWQRFNHRKLLAVFPIAVALLFICNILRVFVLIVAGYYINQHIAFSLFHTYAGMLFFILYSIVFWAVSYRWLLKDGQ